MKKLAIIVSHPIQYYVPLFRELAEYKQIQVKVFYTWGANSLNKFDPGFGKKIEWDIPLLDGYEFEFMKNTSTDPGTHHYKGIDNPELIETILHWKADAILVFGWSFKSHLKCIRYFKDKMPVFFRGDSHLLDESYGIRKMLRKMFLKWVYSYIDIALFVGTNNKKYYESMGLTSNQLVYVPHAVDNSAFTTAIDKKTEIAAKMRHELGIKPSDIVFLFAGKFEEKKNPLLLLKAFIAAQLPNAHLVFIGNGQLEDTMKYIASSHSNIHFMDFQNQSQMPSMYRMGDVFCLPSKGPGETWGLAINEAMVCGLAIIASDKVGCVPDLIKNGENGYVFTSNKLEELVDVLRKIADYELLQKMRARSKKIIEDFTIQKQAEIISAEVLNISR